MKKVVSLILIICMVLCAVPIFAQGADKIVLREELFDRIEEICKDAGCTVFRNDVSIGVTKGAVGFVATKDTVTYMENGTMVVESLYVDGIYVKMPEKAFESLLGKDWEKSVKYKEVMESFQTKLSYGRYIQETIDTDYGTIVIWGSGGHMHATRDEISYVRYDGESLYITNYKVPQANTWMPCKYSAIEISSDGKKAIITYPEIKETVVFSPDAENITLREKGQMVVTVDLVNCTAEYVNHPLAEDDAPEEKASEETSTSGAVNGLYYPDNEKNPTLRWSYNDGTLTISGTGHTPVYSMSYGSGKMGSSVTTVNRPKEWQAYFDKIEEIVLTDEAKTIGNGFFEECVNVKKLVIGEGVTFNDTSFKESETLEEVTLSEKVTIEKEAFQNCDKLEKITVYNNDNIGENAFFGCDNLDVEFKSNNVTIGHGALNETAFSKNNGMVCFENELVWMNDELKTGDIILPENITSVPPYMFQNTTITSVVIPEGVNRIGNSAFRNCSALKTVTFPKGNDFVIEENAFRATGLESVTITKNMRLTFGEISMRAFADCDKLTHATIAEGVESFAPYIFAGCRSLSEVVLPESLIDISTGAFYGCKALQYISIGKNVTKIGEKAFAGSGIVNITIPENVNELGAALFNSCESIKNVHINGNITTMPASVFANCKSLEEVHIPDSITKIEHGAFSGCKIQTVRLPEGLKTIEPRAFSYADIEELVIPEGCEAIGEKAFYYSKLKKLFIPGSVMSLPKEMCSYCKNLKELSIGDGVKTIDTRAFEECDSLEKVTLPESIETLGYETFKWCDNLSEVNIPEKVTQIPGGFAAGCKKLTKVSIGNDKLTGFGVSAFSGCESLYDINIPESLQWVGHSALDKTPLWKDEGNWQDAFFIIGDVLFDIDNEKLGESVVIPKNVRVVPSLGFSGNEKIVEVTIPEGVKVLPDGLFYCCKNLKSVTLLGPLENIEENVFYGCTSLEPVRLPKAEN